MSLVQSSSVRPAARRVSVICAGACVLIAVALPTYVISAWLLMPLEVMAEQFRSPLPLSGALAPWQRMLAVAVNLPSALVLAFGLWRAGSSLLEFSRGRFFAPAAIGGLRDFACATFWSVVIGFFEASATSVIVTWTNGPGLCELTFGIGSPQVFSALYAGIFWVLAAVMARAASLAHENEQFV
jgi:hypothetical protein